MKQGEGSHIKRIENSLWCVDSKDSHEIPIEEFVDNHEVAGFCNTYSIADKCNAKFITIGEEVFLVATRCIRRGEEIFAYYYNSKAKSKAKKAQAEKRAAAAAERRAVKMVGLPLRR
jgi:hypothetical protein